MNAVGSLARRLQSFETAAPPRLRLPLRYHIQRITGALEPEMRLLPELVASDSVALDVGANRGVYAYALARRARAVHCFEPLSECCDYIRAARLPNVTVHNCALSDAAGTLRLYIPTVRGAPVWTRASLERPDGPCRAADVEVRTLDSFGLAGVSFIKVDVEGVEAAVLRGASATLQRERPRLLIEIDRARHSRESCEAVLAWLRDRAYDAHVIEGRMLRRSRDVWVDAGDHVNFVFLPEPSCD